MRSHDIIAEVEEDYGVDLGDSAPDDILCNHDGCRHSECECWDSFRGALVEIAEKQQADYLAEMSRMRSLYEGEVAAGVYVPMEGYK